MELVPLLRELWRRRILVAAGAMAAIAVGVVLPTGGTARTGVASTRVVLDTQRSQLLNTAPAGADTLAWRGALLAELLVSDPVRRSIAHDIGVAPNRLAIVEPTLAVPTVPAALPRVASEAAAVTAEPYVLTVRFHEQLPIVSIEAAAPDRARASALARAATDALDAASSPSGAGRNVQAFVVDRIAPVQAKEVAAGIKPVVKLALPVLLFGCWCIAVIMLPALAGAVRGRRRIQPA